MTVESTNPTDEESRRHERRMDDKYRYTRHVFDISRRFFLFGRDRAIANLQLGDARTVLEIGCGTGRNLKRMAGLAPGAQFIGLEISSEMLKTTHAKLSRSGLESHVLLLQGDAARPPALPFAGGKTSRILMSYVLSMVPDWQRALAAAIEVLEVGGTLSIVDFGNFGGLPEPVARACIGSLARHDAPPCLSLADELQGHVDAGTIRCRHAYRVAGIFQSAIVERLPGVA